MNLLIIDTATEACSVALTNNGQQFDQFEICPQQHSQRILPMIDGLLKEASTTLNEIDYLGFGQGPGSFTGVRIATGILQGLALGTDLHVVGVSTLAAMAQQAITEHQAQDVFCAIDARMGEVYFAHYQAQNGLAMLIGSEQVLPPEEAAEILAQKSTSLSFAVGTGWAAYDALLAALNDERKPTILESVLYPDAKYMLPLVENAATAGFAKEIEQVEPVYLRDKVTWKKLPGRE
ncbi:peptidase M22, glycoprotease [Paraglaciecola sp. T6c]|uniref:tRNA (adenosine(37)-N6)-threonylcarbamoyltransferase complex dimerization subunit type 1 TsaB n=1 Tax=Pseudoalteromonas atlantica (strain T6c / ATCC BAA-1087) TaxID=3042615 RepID=UPI00005C5AC3|nr:tRNA (adenosine(37)-N6)-threonylcarbamoyltransferase complex dimerization subunit type 1 TsaB [Paraglaciecola sp. T6c]ABG41319.1 peptidase M22, glycoprotease [Paraglaciecola sp. T6c]